MSNDLRKEIGRNATADAKNRHKRFAENARNKNNHRDSMSENFRKTSLAKKNDVSSRTATQDNANLPSASTELPNTDKNHHDCNNFSDYDQTLVPKQTESSRLSNKTDPNHRGLVNSHDCTDACPRKLNQALALIVEEIKKVDAAIDAIASEEARPYAPNAEDKREFAKSIEKNAPVCHTIIEELKNQRNEINDMLKMYKATTENFARLETSLNHQREKIRYVKRILESVEEIVKNFKINVNERHENFLAEMKRRRIREATREEILKTFVDWVASLDAQRLEESQRFDSHVERAIAERNEDGALLVLAVKQLQEIKEIETLLNPQRSTLPHEIEKSNN